MSAKQTQFSMQILLQRLFKGCFVLILVTLLNSSLMAQEVASKTAVQTDTKATGKKKINRVRVWTSQENTRLVFDLSDDVRHKIFRLNSPNRLVLDIEGAEFASTLPIIESSNQHLLGMRTGQPKPDVIRFVLELKKPLLETSFVLTPNELYGYRLIIDLGEKGAKARDGSIGLDFGSEETKPVDVAQTNADHPERLEQGTLAPLIAADTSSPEPAVLTPINLPAPVQGKIVVAIDAGHGGVDPGAIGHRGSREKVITLQIAKRLKRVIDRDQRMRAVLVRDGDDFIDLHKRRQMASAKGADIFVSIHADAFKRRSASGLSVFALSQSGATSAMARALAAKENASDLVGGVSLANKDEVLKKVLVDLSMTNTISESVNLGGRVLSELGQIGKLHSKRVEQAGFAVLKSPDIPSILVETGFITNPEEERKLKTSSYQDKLANAIYKALSEYYDQTPYYTMASYSSPAIGVASQGAAESVTTSPSYHRVVRGDTLSEIAQKYGTSIGELKTVNKLRGSTARLGQRLRLPSSSRGIAPAAQVKSKPAEHTVKRGDSLSKISVDYNITIRALKRLNNLSSNTVVPGQKLKLIAGSTASISSVAKEPLTHKVRRGDTLSEIAEKYGSSIRKIMRANNMRSRTVMLGQILKIPS